VIKGKGGGSLAPVGAAQGGKINESKSLITQASSFPQNTCFAVRYVLENSSPSKEQDAAEDVADARYVTVQVQHSFLQMPDSEGFQPRVDDPRIGYFMTQVTDMISIEATPWRDFIHRWRLVKKDPKAEVSEPVQPITFWIENTTPVEFRDIIRTATLRWNTAFEKAGFKNALAVQVQPDDATWSADDLRYNVLRWTSSPKPPFSGYGPSFVNPRTGEILGADIMLEFSSMAKRLFSTKVFAEMGMEGALSREQMHLMPRGGEQQCEAAFGTQMGLLRGDVAMRYRAADKVEMKRLVEEALTKLVLHEVGHTLGLNHNFKASHLHDPVAVHNRELTSKVGLYGSVMDYPCVNLAPLGKPQGEYFMTCVGPYDDWAILYGYSQSLPDAAAESARLTKIAARSHERELTFGNDSDDMRNVGKGIDPDCMVYDMSSDPVTYAEQRCQRAEAELTDLQQTLSTAGGSYQELLNAYAVVTRDLTDALTASSRYIGGVHVERAKHGQGAQRKPFTPVPAEKQAQAMAVLARYAFSPQAWATSPELIAHLQKQRRGFDHREANEDPQVHDRVFAVQQTLLLHCMHSATVGRIMDSELYGNSYTLDKMLSALTAAIFQGDAEDKAISTMRRNLQVDYLTRLLSMATGSLHKPTAQGAAMAQLEQIVTLMELPAFKATPGHASLLRMKMKRELEEK
jgi:hypothetical protein